MCVRRCVSFALSILFLLTLSAALAFGQGAQVRSEYEPIAEQDRDHPQEREQWFLHGRLIPGQSAATLRYRAHLQKMQMRAARLAAAQRTGLTASPQAALASSGWSPLGPAPLASDASGFGQQDYNWVSGRATAVAVDPADTGGNTVYVGGAYGGVWKSTNAGPLSPNPATVTWIPVIDDQATLSVGAIAIQPQPANPDPTKSVILLGTGETNSSGDSYYGLGILRSADAGNTWTLLSRSSDNPARSFAGMGFSKIAFSTSNPNLVVAAAAAASQGITEGLENPVAVNRGLYSSQDGGVSWTYATVKDGSAVIDPGSATAVVFNPAAGKFFAAMRFHGFYSSSDGINWTRLAAQPGIGLTPAACPSHTSSNCPIYRGEFAVVPGRNGPSNTGEMYVWYVDVNETDQGIFRTTDGGSTWTRITDTSIAACGDFLGCGTSQGVYNLELAAVPSGATATDLYAGAINIFKCSINSNNPTCAGSPFINLTHVYGCNPAGSIAHVHPDQHDVDFMVVNGKAILYFANDGGIYRALDGFSGLTTGACGGSNQFDSLSQTLGSMTQFVSFSQHPTDPNTILGGTQDNGSPATASSQTSTSWLNVNAGDGGYNEINPNNPTEWFTANTGVSIQRCTSGISCHSQSFLQVVSNSTLGGDAGPFYTPYILDPQNSGAMIVGTCRVWRGTTSGIGFTVLSNNFEVGGTAICTQPNLTNPFVNQVRSLAAGGPKDANGFSNVIYAGTDGTGPSGAPPEPARGGNVFVTTNAAGGLSTWADRTGVINPSHFPISSIAIDTSDATGQNAYLTIMGFHVSHVWKTTNAGVSWTDFTGNLPDAPANAIVIDPGTNPSTGAVYVGTDVGVFSSSTASPNWTEVGPAPGSGQPDSLPNVSVTALRLFNTTTAKLLRASTYGRGVWQFQLTQDFLFSVSDATQTIFPSQIAIFHGTLTAMGAYNSLVTLSCTGGKPSACDPSPAAVTPTAAGASFAVSAAGAIGDYSFNVHGTGSDTNTTTHDAPLTLQVVDFGLTAPSPSSVTVNRPTTSQAITFQVTASGSFSGTVTLSCGGLPAGAGCFFAPSSAVNPTLASPVTVNLTIGTSASTPPGTFPVTISANSAGAPSAKTQNLTLVVRADPDYTLTANAGSQSTTVNQPLNLDGTLTSLNGYSSTVNLSCTGTPPPTCSVSPSSLTPTAAGAPFTVTVNSNTAATYNFNITGVGSDGAATTHGAPVSLTVNADFSLGNSSGEQTVEAGQTATYTLDFSPIGGSTFGNPVTYTCSSLPALANCSFSPPQIAPSSGATSVTLSVATTAPAPTGTPAGTYTITVSAVSGSVTHSTTVTLTVAVPQATDFSVNDSSGPQTVKAGGTANYTLSFLPTPAGSVFPNVVTYSCSTTGFPALSTCSFNPLQIAAGSGATNVSLSIRTTAPIAMVRPGSKSSLLYALWLPLPGLVIVLAGLANSQARRKRMAPYSMYSTLGLIFLVTVVMTACGGGGGGGGGGQPGTPPGTYTITVNASSGTLTHSSQVSLTVH